MAMPTMETTSVSPFVTRFGFDPSCGEHSVCITMETTSGPLPKIQIRYHQMMDEGEHNFRYDEFMWWNGEKPSVAEIKKLLESANVPAYIQRVHAVDLILECVDHILMKAPIHELMTGRLPSLSAYIFSHQQDLTGFDMSESEEEEEEDYAEEDWSQGEYSESEDYFEEAKQSGYAHLT